MNRLRPLLAVMLLLLWGTATVHCGLELDGLFGEASAHSEKVAGHHAAPQDHDPDGCGEIESGHFESFVASFVVLPPLRLEWTLPHVVVREPILAIVGAATVNESPPGRDLVPSWVFRRRTALPAHAPDAHV